MALVGKGQGTESCSFNSDLITWEATKQRIRCGEKESLAFSASVGPMAQPPCLSPLHQPKPPIAWIRGMYLQYRSPLGLEHNLQV